MRDYIAELPAAGDCDEMQSCIASNSRPCFVHETADAGTLTAQKLLTDVRFTSR